MKENANKPLVSVIMPAYNAGPYIDEAIRSVVDQTVTDWELLVIDDGSSDATCQIVEKWAAADGRIQLIRNEENLGAARTRNRGFSLCRGSFVALLDSDDAWHPEKLEKQLALLEQTGADFSYCSYAIVDAQGNRAKNDYIVPPQLDFERLLRENVVGCSTVLLRREVVQKHQFRADYYHEDYVLWLQLLRAGLRGVGCTEVLSRWRYIETSRSFNKGSGAKNRWMIYRKYLKLPLLKSLVVFAGYAIAGIKKYL